MSQRAAWQLERYGFTDVHDFVYGEAHWLASGRPTVRERPIDRVMKHLTPGVVTIDAEANVARAIEAGHGDGRVVVVGAGNVVLGTLRASDLQDVGRVEQELAHRSLVGSSWFRRSQRMTALTLRSVSGDRSSFVRMLLTWVSAVR